MFGLLLAAVAVAVECVDLVPLRKLLQPLTLW